MNGWDSIGHPTIFKWLVSVRYSYVVATFLSTFQIMVEKTGLRVIGSIAGSIILLITYYKYFGHDSISKYLERRIIITEYEEKHALIPPPGNLSVVGVTVNLFMLQQF